VTAESGVRHAPCTGGQQQICTAPLAPPSAALRVAPRRAAGGLDATPCSWSRPCSKQTAVRTLRARSESEPPRSPSPGPRRGEGPVAEDLLSSSINVVFGLVRRAEPPPMIAEPCWSAAALTRRHRPARLRPPGGHGADS